MNLRAPPPGKLIPLSLAVFTAMLCSCGQSNAPKSRDPSYVGDVPVWSAANVGIECPSGDCPEGVGAVVFALAIKDGYRLQRCTGTIINGDRVLTNAHCGKSFIYDQAYIFVPGRTGTLRFRMGARIYEHEEGTGLESGMGADIAIFALAEPTADGVKPRHIARKVPADMHELVMFKVDDLASYRFNRFVVEKDKCSTMKHQPLFGGGSDDQTVGLALFGCKVARGNSGSPLFVPGNYEDIQVVVNTSYPFLDQKARPLVGRLESLFEQRPTFFHENFAMGNRVHCMELGGSAAPEALCERATVKEEIRRPFATATVKIARERLAQMNTDPAAAWGLRVFPVKLMRNNSDPFPRPGVVMVPYPLCVRAAEVRGELAPQQVQYLSMGIDATGAVASRLQKSQVVKTRFLRESRGDDYQIWFDRDFHLDGYYDLGTSTVSDPEDREAKFLLNQPTTQLARCKGGEVARIEDEHLVSVPEVHLPIF